MEKVSLRVRLCRSTGELEIEGPADLVGEWWERLLSEISPEASRENRVSASGKLGEVVGASRVVKGEPFGNVIPDVFGEYVQRFPDAVSEVDKVLIAATFSQFHSNDHRFTTKVANERLLEQGIRVANASQCVKRLVQSKRAYVVSSGIFQVSKAGLDYLERLQLL